MENTTDNYISSCYESLSVHSLQEGLDELAFRLLFNPRSLIPRLSIFYAYEKKGFAFDLRGRKGFLKTSSGSSAVVEVAS